MTAHESSAQHDGEGLLTYRGQTWKVTSRPEVVDSEGDEQLMEVWVKRGEGIEQPE